MIINLRGTHSCLVGDTLIDCPRDLIEYPKGIKIKDLVGKQFLTYSWDEDADTMTLSNVNRVWCVGKRRVYRVHLTAYGVKNKVGLPTGGAGVGKYLPPCELIGTYDHLVMLSDGTWKKLGELQEGDSLKSFYRVQIYRGRIYWSTDVVKEQLFVGGKEVKRPFKYYGSTKAIDEHEFVCRVLNGPRPPHSDVHHKDRNGFNHTPSNLEWKDISNHRSEHLRDANLEASTGWQKYRVHPRGMLGKQQSSEARRKIGRTGVVVNRQRRIMNFPKLGDSVWLSKQYIDEARSMVSIARELGCIARHVCRELECLGVELRPNPKRTRSRAEAVNHRVLSVPEYIGVESVYDMSVERTQNFVANGVVVHNSGKTTIVKNLLAASKTKPKPIFGVLGPRQPEAYQLQLEKRKKPLFVLGPYYGVPTSGADVITTNGLDVLIFLLEKYRKKGDVLYEGIIVSNNYGSVGEYLHSQKKDVVVAFLDTPLEVCLEGLKARQLTAIRQGKSDQHLREHYKRILRVRERMAGLGFRTETVSRDSAAEKILSWLEK